jgi:hypothetical protein
VLAAVVVLLLESLEELQTFLVVLVEQVAAALAEVTR